MRSHNRFYILLVGWLIGLLLVWQAIPLTQAQTTNITLPTGSQTLKSKSGNTINISGGRRPLIGNEIPGPNVFHTFTRFDLGAGNVANFIRPDTILNSAATTVISNVTGGVPSNINGTIQALGWSNFYFINPSGVIFGPSATLNVPSGSVYISTADRLIFNRTPNSAFTFITRTDVASQALTSSALTLSAFGFTSAAVAPITITGNNLTVAPGKTLAVIGGPITIDGAKLTAPNGKVQVASVASAVGYGGEVNADSLDMTPNPPFGTIVPGRISMSPGNSFAALEGGVSVGADTVDTNPGPAGIQTPPGSRKTILTDIEGGTSLIKVEGALLPSQTSFTSGQLQGAGELVVAAKYPQLIVAPQVAIAAPRLLADRCAGSKDGQFSSFAQVNRDSAPPQPGRYLSSPTILDEALLRAGKASAHDISVAMGTPALLTIASDVTFLVRNDCVP